MVEKAVAAIPDLIKWAVEQKTGRIYNALSFRVNGNNPGLKVDVTWLPDLKVKVLTIVKDIPILLPLNSEKPIPIRDAFIPFHEVQEMRTRLYNLGVYLFDHVLPREGDAWFFFYVAYKELLKLETKPPGFFLTFRTFCDQINIISSVDKLKEKVAGRELTFEEWLAMIYKTLPEARETGLFTEFAIFPTHSGELSKKVPGLRIDGVLDDVLN